MLRLKQISAQYGQSKILHQLDLAIESTDIVTLLGRNGMGKTTSLKTIMGVLKPSHGSIQFLDQDITALSSWQIAQQGIGYVPEGRQIFPNLTVRENLIATARTIHGKHWQEQTIYELFPRLYERRSNMGNQLSGGEQQMLAISRALMTNPKLLILDEATEGLAPLIRREIWSCLKTLKQLNQAILIVDKNIQDLLEIANQHYVLEKGQIVWQGRSDEMIANQAVVDAYLAI